TGQMQGIAGAKRVRRIEGKRGSAMKGCGSHRQQGQIMGHPSSEPPRRGLYLRRVHLAEALLDTQSAGNLRGRPGRRNQLALMRPYHRATAALCGSGTISATSTPGVGVDHHQSAAIQYLASWCNRSMTEAPNESAARASQSSAANDARLQ